VPVSPEETEDLAADVLTQLIQDNFRALRQFEGKSRLSTYLVVIARRLVLRELRKKLTGPVVKPLPDGQALGDEGQDWRRQSTRPEIIEEIHELLRRLPRRLRQIVRMYYLEGRSYEEISTALNIPVNSIGPVLTRARRLLLTRLREREQAGGSASENSATQHTSADKQPPEPS
jgi:RNA polymerase sigma-70 factor (ECF subfamily)